MIMLYNDMILMLIHTLLMVINWKNKVVDQKLNMFNTLMASSSTDIKKFV